MKKGFLTMLAALFLTPLLCQALDLTFHIQETTNNPAADYPVTFAVPLPANAYTDASSFRVTDGSGATMPAQISVLNRHWQTGYVRHILVTVKATLAANEKKPYHLKDDGGNTAPAAPVSVTETGSDVTVNTGAVRFKVKKQNFNLFDEVFVDANGNNGFEAGEQVVMPSADNGGIFVSRRDSVFKSSDATGLRVQVEEAGPIRAIIRVETPAVFLDTARQRPGHMVRFYAWAGKPYVKVEYTLKNSAFVQYAWPLYMKDFSVRTRLNLGTPTVTIGTESSPYSAALGSGLYIYQNAYNTFAIKPSDGASTLGSGVKAPGWLDVSDGTLGVTAYVRYFWETWPNGIEADANKDLWVRMLPKWDAGYFWSDGASRTAFVKCTTGVHWLDDMQHLTREVMYEFHAGSVNAAQAAAQAALFAKTPVAVVPVSWWAQTRVTADMGGIIPLTTPAASPLPNTNPGYLASVATAFGWPNFQGNIIGGVWRMSACEPGDIPYAGHRFMATENPGDYYQDRAYVWGELNVRPEWMGGEVDFSNNTVMQFTTMPYSPSPWCNYSWRPGWGGYGPTPYKVVAPYLPGTDHHGWTSRDAEHLWIYHMEDFYYYDGMPLIKDWYKWIGQFEKVIAYDKGDNRVWRYADRGHGHNLSALMGAYKMTGDSSFMEGATYYVNKLKAWQNKTDGSFGAGGGAALMSGYMTRGLIRYAEEQRSRSCKEYVQAFGMLEGQFQWNHNWCHWCYNISYGTKGTMSGTAMPLSDPQIWMYLHTGYTPYKTETRALADAKIYGDLLKWNLTTANFPVFVGRLCQYAWENPRMDTVPPAAIADLSGQATEPSGGGKLWVKADSLPANQTLYFAIKSFDSTENMSALSNVYSVNLGGATSHYLTWTAPASAAYYHVRWCHRDIRENDSVLADTANWYYFWAANPIGNDINSQVPVESARNLGAPAELSVCPNPLNQITRIQVRAAGEVRLSLVDMAGKVVRNFRVTGGNACTVEWAGENDRGGRVGAGVYLLVLKSGSYKLVKKVILMK